MKIFLMPLCALTLSLFPTLSEAKTLYSVGHEVLMSADGALQGTKEQVRNSLRTLGWSESDIRTFLSLSNADRVNFAMDRKSGEPQKGLYSPDDE